VLRGLLIAVGVTLALWLLGIALLVALGRRSEARELATVIPNLVVLFRGLLGDPRVLRASKAWLWFAVAWLLSSSTSYRSSFRSPGRSTTPSSPPSSFATCCVVRTGLSSPNTGVESPLLSTRSSG
jgi:hypothetical protein